MIIVVPVSRTDDDVKDGFLKTFTKFNSYSNHDLLVVCRPSDEKYARDIYDVLTRWCEFKGSFLHVFDTDGIRGWPRGCNHYWYETGKFLHDQNNTKPWLWMEMDMVPLRYGWADMLEQEYYYMKKPFLGNVADTTTVTSKQEVLRIAKHLVGAAIYPPNLDVYSNLWRHAPDVNVAWDVLCQNDFFPHTHETKLIQHCYRTKKYKKYFDQVTSKVRVYGEATVQNNPLHYHETPVIDFENAVLVHGCEDNSLAEIVIDEVHKIEESLQ